jgi:hypothetical protein
VQTVVTEERPDPVWRALGRLAALSPAEAEGQLPAAMNEFRTRRTAETRLWVLLLLLKAPPREFGDAWALEVLGSAVQEEGIAERRQNLEALIEHIFAERLAQEDALQRAEAELAKERETVRTLQGALDAEHARAEGFARGQGETGSKVRSLEAALQEERARTRDLEGQLEQLKAIEKILQRREGAAGGEGSQ